MENTKDIKANDKYYVPPELELRPFNVKDEQLKFEKQLGSGFDTSVYANGDYRDQFIFWAFKKWCAARYHYEYGDAKPENKE